MPMASTKSPIRTMVLACEGRGTTDVSPLRGSRSMSCRTLGCEADAGVRVSINSPRGRLGELGWPPRSGIRIVSSLAPESNEGEPRVTSTTSGGAPRSHSVMAPARKQASQPPPRHPAQVRLRGSSMLSRAPF